MLIKINNNSIICEKKEAFRIYRKASKTRKGSSYNFDINDDKTLFVVHVLKENVYCWRASMEDIIEATSLDSKKVKLKSGYYGDVCHHYVKTYLAMYDRKGGVKAERFFQLCQKFGRE